MIFNMLTTLGVIYNDRMVSAQNFINEAPGLSYQQRFSYLSLKLQSVIFASLSPSLFENL